MSSKKVPKLVKARRSSMQYAINWMRELALLNGGPMPGLYNGFVGMMRTSVATLIEAGQPVPVMFKDLASLQAWGASNGLQQKPVGKLPEDEVLRLCPTTNPLIKLTASELYWVKATSSYYRLAMVEWCHANYGPGHVCRAHNESIAFFKAVRGDLEKLPRKHKVFGRNRKSSVLLQIDESLKRQMSALELGGDEKIAYQLLQTLDADHVLNRASLKKLPSAWVLLFPVPSDANRGFGRIVERYRTQLSACTVREDLTPETAFKLFCGAMPRDGSQLAVLKKVISGQIQDHKYVDAMCASITSRLNR